MKRLHFMMNTRNRISFLVLIQLLSKFLCLAAESAPPIPCPHIFRYLNVGKEWMGKITLSNLPVKALQLEVVFSQRTPTDQIGALRLYYGPNITNYNLIQGNPIEYAVEFPNPKVRPKLIRIATNGEEICSSEPYPIPTIISFKQVFKPFDEDEDSTEKPKELSEAEQLKLHYEANPFLYFDNATYTQALAVPGAVTTRMKTASVPAPALPAVVGRTNKKPKWHCGRSVAPFVYKAKIPEHGQLPWLTAIYEKQQLGLSFFCSGSLVSPRTVITAAHCVVQRNISVKAIVVFPGRYDLWDYGENDVLPHELETFYIHPDYNNNVFPDADIVLFKLKATVEFSRFVLPICLWRESDDVNLIVNKTARVAGWGATEDGSQVSTVPGMVEARIVSNYECLHSSISNHALTSPRTICAGNRDGSGPCTGDSGTGLIMNRNGTWYLRGIVSAGQTTNDRCNLMEFVIYCDLAKHAKWIRETMWH